MLTRAGLFDVLARATGKEFALDNTLRLVVRSDNAVPESDALEIDASAYSGTHGAYPDPGQWRAGLLDPLAGPRPGLAARVVRAFNSPVRTEFRRRLRLGGPSGRRQALNWKFRRGRVRGVPMIDPGWDAMLPWEIRMPSHRASRLALAIGVLRDPRPTLSGPRSYRGRTARCVSAGCGEECNRGAIIGRDFEGARARGASHDGRDRARRVLRRTCCARRCVGAPVECATADAAL